MRRHFLVILAAAAWLLVFASKGSFAATMQVDGDVIGTITHYVVEPDDNLYAIARRFDVGIVELLAANPTVDPWMPGEGTELILPTMHILPDVERRGIVINLSELRLFYYPDPQTVVTYPIGIGREGWETPTGQTSIIRKRKDPVWIPPASIRKEDPELPAIFPAGADNPLGAYALDLGWEGYRIHGTNHPYGVGKRVSHGCIRLYPEDIEELFYRVQKGTPVTIIDKNYKLGWQGTKLWLEIVPTQQQSDDIAEYIEPEPIDIPDIYQRIEDAAGISAGIDWYAVDEAIGRHNGIPVVIARRDGD